VRRQQGQFDAAVAAFREAIRLDPASAEAHLGLGQVLQQKKDAAGAAAAFAAAEQLNRKKADAQAAEFARSAGLAKLAGGDLAGALERLREAVRLAPEDAQAHAQLARALQKAGARAEAEKHLTEARRLAPWLAARTDPQEDR
jgi:Flp pilus assembly protein TadD